MISIGDIDLLTCLILFILGLGAFILSTISGGGGALVLVPLLNLLIGAKATAPALNLGTFIGRPVRLWLFRNDIDWTISAYYIPSALFGSILAGWLFEKTNIGLLQVLAGVFLISTVFQYRFGKKQISFPVKKHYFFFLGFIVTFISTIIGAVGPILNPFYLNTGISKEKLTGTKTANSFFTGIFQISSYAFFGLLNNNLWIFGLSLGLGATIGNIIGKSTLNKMTEKSFRVWVIAMMVVSGFVLIIKQLR
ncbi:sulfite exporter TauE/SafE family protein [Marinigracilibium pacificum]|uniref:Probable membrane transporter protein n=1 Tax=Marinigracilibium pacificum TaxID=2729599 RepID=A0A848IZF8_9BACT|nr:sulfite exporter TauE/SafE family protein [Marinigracilibium pacificum]NMM49006.1 sulfite exporter TauE/SafE family protein [Marinigracilibium pacificum]